VDSRPVRKKGRNWRRPSSGWESCIEDNVILQCFPCE
jgi:hypothetical protein